MRFEGRTSVHAYGGGFSVFHSVGPLKYLHKKCSNIEVMEGVSAGALLLAIDISHDFDIDKLINVGLEIEKMGPQSIFRSSNWKNVPHYTGPNLYDNEGIKELISRYVNAKKIIDWKGKYIAVTHNESLGINVPFSNKDEGMTPERLNLGILASASLGMLLPEVEIDGEFYSDGLTCSIANSIENKMDNIFLLINHRLDGSDLLLRKKFWQKKQIATMRRSVRQSIVKDIKHAINSGYQLIEENPSRHFEDMEVNKKSVIKNVLGDAIDAINPLNPESITERMIIKRKTIVFTPFNPVATLDTAEFNLGDIKTAMERRETEVERFAKERLEKEL
ncbi:MAG: patatin-like phospholipase family protein [Candidatus Harrisonbacteria bacterium]|nr:patatin-like phospholipase family protein [Candidatus Harrisonbacteria bacterium]